MFINNVGSFEPHVFPVAAYPLISDMQPAVSASAKAHLSSLGSKFDYNNVLVA